jgi:hypothetical protein
MRRGSQTSGDQVLVEGSSLPSPLRNDLRGFLKRQPEVRAVTRKLHIGDPLLSPDSVGLLAPRFDVVVHIAERPQARTEERIHPIPDESLNKLMNGE